jgi:hypothetical protein
MGLLQVRGLSAPLNAIIFISMVDMVEERRDDDGGRLIISLEAAKRSRLGCICYRMLY